MKEKTLLKAFMEESGKTIFLILATLTVLSLFVDYSKLIIGFVVLIVSMTLIVIAGDLIIKSFKQNFKIAEKFLFNIFAGLIGGISVAYILKAVELRDSNMYILYIALIFLGIAIVTKQITSMFSTKKPIKNKKNKNG